MPRWSERGTGWRVDWTGDRAERTAALVQSATASSRFETAPTSCRMGRRTDWAYAHDENGRRRGGRLQLAVERDMSRVARDSRYLPRPDSDGNSLAPPSRMVLGNRVAGPGEAQREVAGSFARALGLAPTGIGRPLNATPARAPALAVAAVTTQRTGRGGGTPASRLEHEARPGSGRYAAGAEHSRPGDV